FLMLTSVAGGEVDRWAERQMKVFALGVVVMLAVAMVPVWFWRSISGLVYLLALVLYVIFLPFAPIIFWGLNGFLLGREYFHLVAVRRVGLAEARRLRKLHFASIWAAGTLMAVPLSVPLLNLVIPIFGVATFTHIFHRLTAVPMATPSD
ncbi:MAG: EI24 domain-containing protein, partial [Pseudomonadota bacterium]